MLQRPQNRQGRGQRGQRGTPHTQQTAPHHRPTNTSIPSTNQVHPNAHVSIILKADQATGDEVQGIVKDVLTRGEHPRGIKVRLRDGRVGRVQRIVGEDGVGGGVGMDGALGRDGEGEESRGGRGSVMREKIWTRRPRKYRLQNTVLGIISQQIILYCKIPIQKIPCRLLEPGPGLEVLMLMLMWMRMRWLRVRCVGSSRVMRLRCCIMSMGILRGRGVDDGN